MMTLVDPPKEERRVAALHPSGLLHVGDRTLQRVLEERETNAPALVHAIAKCSRLLVAAEVPDHITERRAVELHLQLCQECD